MMGQMFSAKVWLDVIEDDGQVELELAEWVEYDEGVDNCADDNGWTGLVTDGGIDARGWCERERLGVGDRALVSLEITPYKTWTDYGYEYDDDVAVEVLKRHRPYWIVKQAREARRRMKAFWVRLTWGLFNGV